MSARQVTAAVCIMAALLTSPGPAVALTEADRSAYAAAVAFCRTRPGRLALEEGRSIFCFDGAVRGERDVSALKSLNSEGLFVVRSPGGTATVAASIATMLEEKKATVVIYDYCFSACASFFLIAGVRTYVLKDSIVAWHHGGGWRGWSVCEKHGVGYRSTDGTWRATRELCHEHSESLSATFRELRSSVEPFFKRRTVDQERYNFFERPPRSQHIARILAFKKRDTGTDSEAFWTWNPRYHKSALRTEVIYEKYPESQDEVDALMQRLLGKRARSGEVLHDP